MLSVQDGEIVYRRSAGLADASALPMPNTGVSPCFAHQTLGRFGAALVELGKFTLADPVTRYLPDFRPAAPNGEIPTITLRHLLTHTAGLSYGFMQPADGSYHHAGVSDGVGEPGVSMEENLACIARAGLAYAPGERWGYSVAIDARRRDAVSRVRSDASSQYGTALSLFDWLSSGSWNSSICWPPYADGKPAPLLIAAAAARACS